MGYAYLCEYAYNCLDCPINSLAILIFKRGLDFFFFFFFFLRRSGFVHEIERRKEIVIYSYCYRENFKIMVYIVTVPIIKFVYPQISL